MSGAENYIEEYLRHAGYAARSAGTAIPTGVDYANPLQYNLISDGEIPDPSTIKAEQVNPLFSDEWVVSVEHALDNDWLGGEWVVGAQYTHRVLSTQIDDIGINPATVAWAVANGYDINDVYWIIDPEQHPIDYVLANPGEDIRVATDLLTADGSLVWMDLTAEMLGYDKPDRTYDALELTAEKETEKWGISGSYVYAKSEGNTEGMVKSDIGQDDAGLTQDFDLVGVMLNAYGPLPIQAKHQLKVSGYYVVNDQIRVGGNLRVRAPREFSCFGVLPNNIFGDENNAYDINGDWTGDLNALRQVYEGRYDENYWFCGGQPAPRGSSMKSDWTWNVDASAQWSPVIDSAPGALTFRIDIFNLFDSQSATDLFEGGEDLGGPLDNYGTPSAYQAPRSVRLSANWKFQ
jgi:hypothetical protein